MIWPNTLQELSSYLNSFHKNIKFVTEGSATDANFLTIQTALYIQPKDSHFINIFIAVRFSLTSETKLTRQLDLKIMQNESFSSSTYPYKTSIPSFQLKTSLPYMYKQTWSR